MTWNEIAQIEFYSVEPNDTEELLEVIKQAGYSISISDKYDNYVHVLKQDKTN